MTIQTDVDNSVADLLGTGEYRKIRKIDDDFLDRAKQTGMRKIESASGNWLIRAFQLAKKIFAQVQAPDKEIYYAVPNEMVKEAKKDKKVVVPISKPRDPNHELLTNKRRAGGEHRDKKREGKDGIFKHKKDPVDESKLSFKDWLIAESKKEVGDDSHPFSVKILHKGKDKKWPALKGEIYEKDVLIGTFSRGAVRDGYIPPIEYKFRTERARDRFDDFADSLTIPETIEALIPH
jgi:hypothetical protein